MSPPAPMTGTGTLTLPVHWDPADALGIDILAPLARATMLPPGTKPTGLPRLRHKLAKLAFEMVHQRLGVIAPGTLRIARPRPHEIAIDCANTSFADFALHHAADGCYEPETSALFSALADRIAMAFDVGANWGYFSVLLGTHPAFRGRIHAFEIVPRTFRDLEAVIGAAGLARTVTCHPFGLSDRDGEADLLPSRHSVLARIAPRGSGTVPVAVRRLDGLDLPRADLVKLDVEGHEFAVLRGFERGLAQAKPFIVFESWLDQSSKMDGPLGYLEQRGYSFYRLSTPPTRDRLVLLPMPRGERARHRMVLQLLAVHSDRRTALGTPA
jgi:FkbM family methyltransferase